MYVNPGIYKNLKQLLVLPGEDHVFQNLKTLNKIAIPEIPAKE
jgi:hypothetical protein